jgi:hypothetical protein
MTKIGPCMLWWYVVSGPLLLISFLLGICGYKSKLIDEYLDTVMEKLGPEL